MPGLTVGPQAIPFRPSGQVTLVNLGAGAVYIDTNIPSPISPVIEPLGAIVLDGTQSYYLMSDANGPYQLISLAGMSQYIPSPVQSAALQTTNNPSLVFSGIVTGIGPGSFQNFSIPLTTRSITIVMFPVPGGGSQFQGFNPIQIIGNTTGLAYNQLSTGQQPINQTYTTFRMAINGTIEAGLNISASQTAGTGMQTYVYASNEDLPIGTSNQPLNVMSFFNTQAVHSVFNVTVAANGNGVLLAPPSPSGKLWELASLAMRSIAAYTGVGAAVIKGTTSNLEYLSMAGTTGGLPYNSLPFKEVVIQEGLTAVTSATGAPSTIFSCVARLVTL